MKMHILLIVEDDPDETITEHEVSSAIIMGLDGYLIENYTLQTITEQQANLIKESI